MTSRPEPHVEPYREPNHLEFLRRHELWPQWPYCPVKRYVAGETWPVCGLVPAGGAQVVELNLFISWTSKEWNEAVQHSYASLEELVADGWVVD